MPALVRDRVDGGWALWEELAKKGDPPAWAKTKTPKLIITALEPMNDTQQVHWHPIGI